MEREETLDPADWDDLRQLGHRMVDDMLEHLRTVRERPVWRSPDGPTRAALAPTAPPHEGQPLADVYRDFQQYVLPFPTGNIHPRFWGWVMGTGSPQAALAE